MLNFGIKQHLVCLCATAAQVNGFVIQLTLLHVCVSTTHSLIPVSNLLVFLNTLNHTVIKK